MLSAAQQRGRLRQLIIRELKSADLKAMFRGMLRDNNQNVSGFLQRSITSSKFETSLRVSSSIDQSTGVLDRVRISVNLPYGKYGRQLDSIGSIVEPATTPSVATIVQWITQKGISANQTVKRTLKDGSQKTYTYNNTLSAKKHMAYHIVKNIAERGRVKTVYDYTSSLESELEFIINTAVADWFDEIGLSFLGDVEVEIANLI